MNGSEGRHQGCHVGLHEEYQGAWNVASSQGVVFRLNLHMQCHVLASFNEVTIRSQGGQ